MSGIQWTERRAFTEACFEKRPRDGHLGRPYSANLSRRKGIRVTVANRSVPKRHTKCLGGRTRKASQMSKIPASSAGLASSRTSGWHTSCPKGKHRANPIIQSAYIMSVALVAEGGLIFNILTHHQTIKPKTIHAINHIKNQNSTHPQTSKRLRWRR